MRLDNKTAIITGGGSGMGAAIAHLFAKEGGKVLLADVNEDGVASVKAAINEAGGIAEFIIGDVAKEVDCLKIIETSLDKFGKLDVLVNNAGRTHGGDVSRQYDSKDLEEIFKVNTFGPFYLIKHAVPHMKNNGGGSIVNISSNSTMMGTDFPIYASSKGALNTMTEQFAGLLAPYGIRVNTLIPGLTRTPLVANIMNQPELLQKYGEAIPLGRVIEPEDIAYGALYLASDEASMVTGTKIIIDGGISL